MPLYEFKCPRHGVFELLVREFVVPVEPPCPVKQQGRGCCETTRLVPSAPALVSVERGWNEKANDYRRDPYTQAKAQLTNLNRERQKRGERPVRITEAAVQAGARAIAAEKRPRKSVVQRVVEHANKQRTKK